ncbi:cupin domain-containing protein [Salinibacterium sp. SWN1162]|uniref:cupin domain-containing protein n=1 Tax=Salinibacterium sp. SWN1162 TaxID=2792053 RepID=UPI0018CE6483|nr:cupin domain-containing protein [Salinibacterium sp. SWN1162]MBH0007831.1 cupin domain-containing protein [Salinibacterium sp. SWN1162]
MTELAALLAPATPLAASAVPVTHEALGANEVVEGTPTAGYAVLDTLGDSEIGVWEMSVGTATDTEVDEVFVVISGRASIHFAADDRTIAVGPGDVVRLTDGMQTTWTITETLRKIYVS